MHSQGVLLAGVCALISGARSHMIMNTPTPYGAKTLQTSPLNGDGYNFPCQSGSRTDAFDAEGASNPMTVGEDNPLKFTGSAVHGGGSCQLSVTYEYPPPADKSKWKVIHSFIGSCPANAAGNLPTSATDADGRPSGPICTSPDQTECLPTFNFKIPEGMKNGNATLAWTWFNKLGNREMYMNCAPISISGGSDDDTFFNSLPEIFVANIPGECTTESGVMSFPNPGDQVTYGEAATPGANGGCPAPGSGSGSSGSSSATVSATSSAAGSGASDILPLPSISLGLSAGLSITYSAVQAAKTSAAAAAAAIEPETSAAAAAAAIETPTAAAAQSTTLLTAYSAPSSAPAAAAASISSSSVSSSDTSSSSSSNGTCEAGKVSCPTPGSIICIGASQFGLCNIDNCAVPEALAAGTTCALGVISKRDQYVRRSSHLHRRHAGLHGGVHQHSF
ncbi:hypothetical protein AAFC00_003209 [Neodothiora populina]|uniref:Lytic polysaccharide monooxygenase n=1 Tax=Neodothiora populina TaxID=2781224 RepID=A0ABR3P9P2_9PEZI